MLKILLGNGSNDQVEKDISTASLAIGRGVFDVRETGQDIHRFHFQVRSPRSSS
jgi:hypothetical protein